MRSPKSKRMPVSDLSFTAIGTQWQIETTSALESEVVVRIRARIDEFDRTYSRFRDDSLVSAVATSAGRFDFPEDAIALFALYDTLFENTDGAVTPLVGRSLSDLGYDADYSLMMKRAGSPAADWRAEVHRHANTVVTTSPHLIDVGAAGKGYLVDIVGDILTDNHIDEFVIDASGDLLVSTAEPRRVGLEHPFDPSLAIGVVEMTHGAICASGSNRRVWGEGLHHILDGRTGAPTSDVIATWAIADSALVADGLATALFFADPDRLAALYEFHYVRLLSSGRAERSPGLPGELFS
jgi:thiamine biosynthesis lipoprotein